MVGGISNFIPIVMIIKLLIAWEEGARWWEMREA